MAINGDFILVWVDLVTKLGSLTINSNLAISNKLVTVTTSRDPSSTKKFVDAHEFRELYYQFQLIYPDILEYRYRSSWYQLRQIRLSP